MIIVIAIALCALGGKIACENDKPSYPSSPPVHHQPTNNMPIIVRIQAELRRFNVCPLEPATVTYLSMIIHCFQTHLFIIIIIAMSIEYVCCV